MALILLDCALHVVDSTRVWEDRILSDVELFFEADDRNADLLTSYRKEHKMTVLDIIRDLIEAAPERGTGAALADLSEAIERNLFVLDQNGAVVAASRREYDFAGIDDADSGFYALNSVLNGKADHKAFTISEGETSSLPCWAVRFRQSDRVLVSMDSLTQAISFADYYPNYQVPEGLVLFVVDLKTGEILSSSNEAFSDSDVKSVGLREEGLKDDFAADLRMNGKTYFVQTNVLGNRADMIAVDHGYLVRQYSPVVLATVAVGLLTVLMMFALIRRIRKDLWIVPEAAVGKESREGDAPGRKEANAEFYWEEDGQPACQPQRGGPVARSARAFPQPVSGRKIPHGAVSDADDLLRQRIHRATEQQFLRAAGQHLHLSAPAHLAVRLQHLCDHLGTVDR